jgi:F-type H+-transporting ATPase subunit epsilon
MLLDVTILNPKEILFEGQAKSIIFPGEQGVFEVLAYHKPLLSRLISGIMLVDDKNFSILRGIVKVNKNKVTVIVEENT